MRLRPAALAFARSVPALSALFALSALSALLACALPCWADVFVVPLPGLAGPYAVGPAPAVTQRTTTFHLPGLPALVRGVSLHVIGTSIVGEITCDDSQPPQAQPWPASVIGEMLDPPNFPWSAQPTMPLVSGPVDVTDVFATTGFPGEPAGTWDFLSDGTGDITLIGGPGVMLLGCSSTGPMPSVNVEQAWLLVDADIAVPAHSASWGSVKAIYR